MRALWQSACILALLGTAALGQETGLRAGAATSNITPPLGHSINGSMSNIVAAHVHDDLHVRCLVLDDGKAKVAFAVCDSCAVPLEIVEQAKRFIEDEAKIPADHVLISATHSHSAGSMTEAFQTDRDRDYNRFVARRIADGVRCAMNNLRPASVGWGATDVPEHLNCRRWFMKPGTIVKDPFGNDEQARMNPAPGSPELLKPVATPDPQLALLWANGTDGRPIALLANYGLHYVGNVGPGHLSADYFGYFARDVRKRLSAGDLDPPFVAIMTNGASGDVNNINFTQPDPPLPAYAKMQHVATDLAEKAVKVAQSSDMPAKVSLNARTATLQLGVRKPTAEELSRAQKIVDEAGGLQATMKTLEQIYARETVMLDKYPDKVPVSLQAIRVGDLGIVAIPCEVFAAIGMDIKKNSPMRQTFIIELANGYNGYLPTAADHKLGGYETWRARSSYLEVDAADKIKAKALELLKDVAK